MKIFNILILFFLFIKFLHCNDDKSIEIIAESMEWDKQKGQAIAKGNAKAVKGDTIITANQIIAIMNSNSETQKIVRLLANGNVEFSNGYQLATGNNAVYNLDKNEIIIKGNVNLKREENIIKGDKLIIDFETGLSKMLGSTSEDKVKMKYSTE